jgi:hypothetical protein
MCLISWKISPGAGGGDDRALHEVTCKEEPDEEWCAQRGLLDPGTCSEVAKHCNETKMAAKTVQVGACKLFLLSVDHWRDTCRAEPAGMWSFCTLNPLQ